MNMKIVPFHRGHRHSLANLHNEMDDLFDSFFRGLDRPFAGYKAWPAVDVAEEEDAFIVKAEVPGCKADDIEISDTLPSWRHYTYDLRESAVPVTFQENNWRLH